MKGIKMYKKNLEMYERLDGWERVAIGEQLRRWAKKISR